MKRSSKTITIHDVAKEAGVSVSTVSRVLNGKDDVAEETVEKVQAVVRELGYASSLAARGMRSHRTNVIGLIMPDVASPYCQEIMRGVNTAIASLNKDLIIYTSGNWYTENRAQHERSYVTLLNGGIADGVVVVTPMATTFNTYAPVVIIDPNNETPDLPALTSTNFEGALAAMKYLVGLGHRQIGFITGRLSLVSANQRLQGYKEGLLTAGISLKEELVEIGDYTTETAVKCARKLISLTDRPTAIFASNDMSAMGVYQAAKEAGLRIPDDLSVIGFDNLHDSAFMDPTLTTVDQFIEDIGTIATQMVVMLVGGEALPACLPGTVDFIRDNNLFKIPIQLVIRDSCSSIS
jgi:LacI family transcriptional regulator